MTEDRKKILVEACIEYIEQDPELTVFYDETDCDGYCLIEDLKIEFNLGEYSD